MYMLDMDMCIYVNNDRDPSLRERFETHADTLCISAISCAELEYGVVHSRRKKHNDLSLAAFAKDLDILPFDQDRASYYGAIRHALARKGKPIGANDMLIAAHARSIEAILVTNNEREFRRVPKLRVDNWLKEANA